MTTDIEAARKAAEIAKAELRGEITTAEAERQRGEYGIMGVKKEPTPTPVAEPTPTKVEEAYWWDPITKKWEVKPADAPITLKNGK